MEIDDFVAVQPDAYSPAFCSYAIDCFEKLDSIGHCRHRSEIDDTSRIDKDDHAAMCTGSLHTAVAMEGAPGLYRSFNDAFWSEHYPAYAAAHPGLQDFGGLSAVGFKLQRTRVGGGYHMWHFEDGSSRYARRMLAWMVYLNDVAEGGETEFLYQHRRVRPKAGTLLIWPAGFTHTHRGNPPLSNDKYVATGWVEL